MSVSSGSENKAPNSTSPKRWVRRAVIIGVFVVGLGWYFHVQTAPKQIEFGRLFQAMSNREPELCDKFVRFDAVMGAVEVAPNGAHFYNVFDPTGRGGYILVGMRKDDWAKAPAKGAKVSIMGRLSCDPNPNGEYIQEISQQEVSPSGQ